jgi:hypothetical protein
MENCPYIEFGSLQTAPEGGALAAVHRRAATASSLGLSERLLLEAAVLCGNDFTSEYALAPPGPGSEFLDAPPLSEENKSAIATVSAVIEWVQSKDAAFEALPARAGSELDIALRYSRAFYGLQDLSPYRAELQQCRHAAGHTAQEESLNASLSDEEKADLTAWLAARAEGEGEGESAASQYGQLVLQYVSSKPVGPRGKGGKGGGRVVVLYGSDVPVGEDHAAALAGMLAALAGAPPSAAYESDPVRAGDRARPAPSWGDLMAAHAYQLLALRAVRGREEAGRGPLPQFQPMACFDGALFYAHLRGVRAAAALAEDALTDSLANMQISRPVQEAAAAAPAPADNKPQSQQLPIDAYREEILYRVNRDRVIIIHGETGERELATLAALPIWRSGLQTFQSTNTFLCIYVFE